MRNIKKHIVFCMTICFDIKLTKQTREQNEQNCKYMTLMKERCVKNWMYWTLMIVKFTKFMNFFWIFINKFLISRISFEVYCLMLVFLISYESIVDLRSNISYDAQRLWCGRWSNHCNVVSRFSTQLYNWDLTQSNVKVDNFDEEDWKSFFSKDRIQFECEIIISMSLS